MSLPPQIRVLERGWLSSNNIVFLEGTEATLIDSGYVSHAEQTVALLRHVLEGRRLMRLINTHSHSDHMGGNAAVRRAFGCRIAIPAGIERAVAEWDEHALLLAQAQQRGERFLHDDVVSAGDMLELGGMRWRAYAAPGHDMDALVFHCPDKRILISGDALWQNGFGVVFDAVLGRHEALDVQRETLDMIGRLEVDIVIPGHGAPFRDVAQALERARQRCAAFRDDPERLARHATKVIFTFFLLDAQQLPLAALPAHLLQTSIYCEANERYLKMSPDELADWLVRDLTSAGAIEVREGVLYPLVAP